MRDFFRRLGRSFRELSACLVPITCQLVFSFYAAFALTHMAVLFVGVLLLSLSSANSVEVHQTIMIVMTTAVTSAIFRNCLETSRIWEPWDGYNLLAKLFLAVAFSNLIAHSTIWLGQVMFGDYGVAKLSTLGLVVLIGTPFAYYSLFRASKSEER